MNGSKQPKYIGSKRIRKRPTLSGVEREFEDILTDHPVQESGAGFEDGNEADSDVVGVFGCEETVFPG